MKTAFSATFCCLKTANEIISILITGTYLTNEFLNFKGRFHFIHACIIRKQKTDKTFFHFTIRKTQTVNTQFFIISLNSKVSTLIKHRTSRLSYNSCSLTPQISIYLFHIDMSSRLFKSLNTLTLPNLVTPVNIVNNTTILAFQCAIESF